MRQVTHVITGLGVGGAERALYNLLSGLPPEAIGKTRVVSLTTYGSFGPLIRALGIPVEALELNMIPVSWFRLFRWWTRLRADTPDVVLAWMYHANVIAWLTTRWLKHRPVLIWNIRHALYFLAGEKVVTRWVIRAHRWLSRGVQAVVYNSHLALAQHQNYGIKVGRSFVIPNGFDLNRWYPHSSARDLLRRTYGIPHNAIVVGHVARYHVLKDQAILLRAMCDVMSRQHTVHFVLIGRDLNRNNLALASLIEALPQDRLRVLGERDDVEQLMRMMDIFCLSSRSEAFPNVLGEAMASGVVCVTTDVGDARDVVGEIGRVVSSGNAMELAQEVEYFVKMGSDELKRRGMLARARIQEHYEIKKVVKLYLELFSSL